MIKYIGYTLLISYSTYFIHAQHDVNPALKVDFLESTLHVAQQLSQTQKVVVTPEQVQGWQLFKPLYDMHILNKQTYDDHVRIPKIIHHIWLGSPLPAKYARYIETWKKHHPDWTFILWDEAKIARLGLINLRPYCAAKNYGEQSDIVRYEILYRFGGLYVDTDFECLQSFDALHHLCDFYAGSYPHPGGGDLWIINAIIASRPEHPILKRCIAGIQKPVNRTDTSSAAIMDRTGPSYFMRAITSSITAGDDIGNTVIFPVTFFYPLPTICRSYKHRSEIIGWIRPESLAVHHWAASWTPDFGPASCLLVSDLDA
jgi:mannosyltransferase OCH1-like enzyme